MRKTAWSACLLLLAAVGWAEAQVAAPDLLPAAPRYVFVDAQGFNGATITPDNPAALQWNTNPRVAIGMVQHEAGTAPSVGYDGNFFGAHWVSESWAVGVERLRVERDDGTESESASSIQASYPLFGIVAIGVGGDFASTESPGSKVDAQSQTLGMSLALGETLYLGYGVGKDSYENNANVTASRDSSMWGIALRSTEGFRWYLGWDQVFRPSDFTVPWGGVDAGTLTAQVGVGDWLFGWQRTEIDQPSGVVEINADSYDLAWARADGGLTISARMTNGEALVNGIQFQTNKTRSLILAYLF